MSDEDRLRERLREQVAQVPVMADLDDVAARIGQRGTGRARRLSVLVVAGLVVGSLGGYAVGRITRDDPHAVTVGGASEPTGGDTSSTVATSTTWTSVTTCAVIEPRQGKAGPPCAETPQTLPEPGPDQPANVAVAREDVARAYADAYDGDASNATHMAAVQGGAGLAAVFDELRNGPVGAEVRAAKTVVDGVVFLSPTSAAVEFHSDLGAGATSGPFFGDAILTADGWQISHASFCQMIIPAGVHCPM